MKSGWLETLNELVNSIDRVPIGIEVNPDWLDVQIRLGNMSKNKSADSFDLSLINGIPIYLNKEINSYKFVYKEGNE